MYVSLVFLGIGLVTRKVGNAVSPVIDLQKNGDEYVLSSSSTFKNFTTKFTPGVESNQETIDGRKVKATFTIDGNTINEVQKDPSGAVSSIERKFSDDEVVMVSKKKLQNQSPRRPMIRNH